MEPIRQIIDNASAPVPVPPALRHRRIEVVMRALDEAPAAAASGVEPGMDVQRFAGTLDLPIDNPVQWQRAARDEWL